MIVEPKLNRLQIMKILLIDDSKVYISLIRHLLNDKYEVFSFSNYNEAKSLLDTNLDCILIDYFLENDVTAIQCIKDIRETHPFIPIIVFTASENESIIVNSFKAGANDYISKQNLNSESLNQTIYENIENFRNSLSLITSNCQQMKQIKQKFLNYDN